jgi:hypothetical protein
VSKFEDIHDDISPRRRVRGPGLHDVVGRVPTRGGSFDAMYSKRIPEWRRGAPNLSAFLRVICASALKKFGIMAQRLFVGFEPRLYTVLSARREPEVRRIMLQKLIKQFSVFDEYPEAVNSTRYAQQWFRAQARRSVCAGSRRHRHGSTRCRGWMRGGRARRPSNWQAGRLPYGSRS